MEKDASITLPSRIGDQPPQNDIEFPHHTPAVNGNNFWLQVSKNPFFTAVSHFKSSPNSYAHTPNRELA